MITLITFPRRTHMSFRSASVAAAFGLLLVSTAATAQQSYPTPESAAQDLIDSAKANTPGFVTRIFGKGGKAILESGDAAEDARHLAEFNDAAAKASAIDDKSPDAKVLRLGTNGWTFPVPLVNTGTGWRFDPALGKVEIENRAIGHNELSAIAVCRAYVKAQDEYFRIDRDSDSIREYARKIISSPGTRDGLYWPSRDQADISPLDGMISDAGLAQRAKDGPSPYNGYFFKILTQQGSSAPGGAHPYVINGHMIAGHALLAWPAQWGKSGVQAFICAENGKVFQKDLGARSGKVGARMTKYDPDPSWTLVE
jgi:hypothetical protein